MRKKMKQKLLGLILLLGVSLSANAQFGGLLGGKPAAGGGGADPAAIEKFTVDAALINKAITYASLQIIAALGDKNNLAGIKQSLEKMNSSDPKDQNAVMGTVLKTDLAASIDLLKSKEGKEKMEKLSPEMQQKVAKSIFAVGVAALRLKPMMDNGQKVVQGMGSNPAMLSKLGLVKDSLSLLGTAAPKVPDLVTAGFALMKDVKVDPGNPTSDSELKLEAVTIPD
jgi:hypothetical protein